MRMWEKKKLESQYNTVNVFDSDDISRTIEEKEEKEEVIAVVVMMVVATDRRSTIDGRQYQTYSIVNEQSFESNMRCPRMLGIHIQAVKVHMSGQTFELAQTVWHPTTVSQRIREFLIYCTSALFRLHDRS